MKKRTERNNQGGVEVIQAQVTLSHSSVLFPLVGNTQRSDRADLTEHKWVWRLHVYVPVWVDTHLSYYLFIMKGRQLMKRSVAPSFALHQLIMSLLYTHTRCKGDFMLWHSAVGWERNRNEVKKKRKSAMRSRLVGWKKERQQKRGVTKKKRSGRVKWKGFDGWETRGVETATSSTRLQHSSYLSVRQQTGGRVDRQKTKTTLTPAACADAKVNVFCKGLSTGKRQYK